MTLDDVLLDVLVCPEDNESLYWFEDEMVLYNPRLQRKYEVRDGIPVMLIEEATAADSAEHARLMARVSSEQVRATAGGMPQ
jgi:uncharacterized protein YbaR (Trm112 family)